MENKVLGLALMALVFSGLMLAAPVGAATLGELKNAYNTAKDEYKAAKNEYINAKADYEKAKADYARLKNAPNLKTLTDSTRTYLDKAIDHAIKYLTAVNKGLEILGAEQKDKDAISGYITWFEGEKTELPKATTLGQIKTEATKIRKEWNDVKKNVKTILLGLMIDKYQQIADKAKALSADSRNRINEMTAAGQKTDNAETLLNKIDAKLNDVQTKLETAKADYATISTLADANALLKSIHETLKTVNEDLRDGYGALKDLKAEFQKTRARVPDEILNETEKR